MDTTPLNNISGFDCDYGWEHWYTHTLESANSQTIELDFQPTGFSLRLDGTTLSRIDPEAYSVDLTPQLCQAIVDLGKTSIQVNASGASLSSNWITAGAWTVTTRTNLLITPTPT